mgnify:FL=1
MSLKKFKSNEVFTNTMKLHPTCNFIIYDTKVIYNSVPHQSGARNDLVRNVSSSKGYVSLYEYNIDRPDDTSADRIIGRTGSYTADVNAMNASTDPITVLRDNGRIYPWISKDSARSSFKTVTGFEGSNSTTWNNEFIYGDVLVGTYPLKAAISREYITTPFESTSGSYNAHYVALRNKLNYYSVMSRHYAVTSSYGNKDTQTLNLISVPSIFYGTQIKPGTLSLKWYVSGALQGEVRDVSQNGELIQTGPYGSTGSGSVAGVVLYDDGIVLLTGSWNLNDNTWTLDSAGQNPSWIHYGVGANDGASPTPSASFTMDFKGTNETQVMTMFAHAKRGEINYSTNPTFLEYGQENIFYSSSAVYEENTELKLKNIASSSYDEFNAPFERQVYVSRVGIYDKDKNLIAVATLSSPILKKEAEDISFKLKLDI